MRIYRKTNFFGCVRMSTTRRYLPNVVPTATVPRRTMIKLLRKNATTKKVEWLDRLENYGSGR